MLSKTSNKPIARYMTLRTKAITMYSAYVKSSIIGIIDAHGDDDVFPSSSPKGEYILLEWCGCHKGLTNTTNASPYSPVNFCHKSLVQFSTKGFLEAKPSIYTKLGACIHNLIGSSRESPPRHHKATKPSSVPRTQE
jgi:hypothetical protein